MLVRLFKKCKKHEINFKTYLDNDVDIAKNEGNCSKMVKYRPIGFVIGWFLAPYISHCKAPKNIHYYERNCDQNEL